MPWTIRRATPADTAVIADFNRRLAEETEDTILDPAVLAEGVAAALADPRKAIYWVAEQGATAVGQISITTEWSDWRNGWLWWIQSVYIRRELRGLGVFRTLDQHVYQTAC